MRNARGIIEADNLSDAWLQTLSQVADASDRKLFQTVTRVANPDVEDIGVRAAADRLLESLGYQPIDTVANTVFPIQLAASSRDPEHLAERYRAVYSTIRRIHKSNRRGTYFGRLVAYPAETGPLDQLSEVVRKLRQERRGDRPKGARYELPIASGYEHTAVADPEAAEDEPTAAVPIHAAGRDTSPMDFPCLSLCSFQLDHDRLHLAAHYRSQYLVQRGYGNYLGLARLQTYVAHLVGIESGQLLVVAGIAHADAAKYRLADLTSSVLAGRREG